MLKAVDSDNIVCLVMISEGSAHQIEGIGIIYDKILERYSIGVLGCDNCGHFESIILRPLQSSNEHLSRISSLKSRN